MGLSYPHKFSYLNTVVIELALKCLDNGKSSDSEKFTVSY